MGGMGGHRGLGGAQERDRAWKGLKRVSVAAAVSELHRLGSQGQTGLGEGLQGCWVVKLKQDFKYSWSIVGCIASYQQLKRLMIVLVLVMMTMTLTMKGWRQGLGLTRLQGPVFIPPNSSYCALFITEFTVVFVSTVVFMLSLHVCIHICIQAHSVSTLQLNPMLTSSTTDLLHIEFPICIYSHQPLDPPARYQGVFSQIGLGAS